MATGRLGVAAPAATTWTQVYIVPLTTFGVLTLSLCNRGGTAATVRVAVTTTAAPGTPANTEFIEYDSTIVANGVLERTGIVMDAASARYLNVYASTANITAVAYGIETSTA